MAVPTITAVKLRDGTTPAIGLTTGLQLIKIVGTNFRVSDGEPVGGGFGDPDADWLRTVQVTINGEDADSVVPASDTLCWVVVPEYLGDHTALPATVDVVLRNLDDNGDPIAGEEVTAADAYTYRRQDFTAEGALKWVTEQMILFFRRHLLAETVLTSDPDYSTDPESGLTAYSELPLIVLVGPRIIDDPYRLNWNRNDTEADAGGAGEGDETYAITVPRMPKRLLFQVHVVTDHKGEILNLIEAVDNVFFKRPRLKILANRGGSDTIDLPMRLLDDEWMDADDPDTNIKRSTNTLEIQGLNLVDTHGVESFPPIDHPDAVAFVADEDAPTLEAETYDGT